MPTRVPGEAGTWVFVVGDMLIFALLFGAFVHTRAGDPAGFDAAQQHLSQDFGAVNTLLLLTSSLLVVWGIRAIRDGRPVAARLFAGALACGAGFAVVKGFEWGEQLSAGRDPASDDFFMYYYVLTGLHFVHLLVGMGMLALLVRQARRPAPPTPERLRYVEGGATYWHMVDLLWIVLFPLLYLVHG